MIRSEQAWQAVALWAAASLLSACGNGTEPAADPLCPSGVEATFDSLNAHVFSVSCGTEGGICHSSDGYVDSGELNLADDPYTALLGTGSGAPADNIAGGKKNLVRVVPGDPESSFLVIKLRTRTLTDPSYGAGMPRTRPGGLCGSVQSAVVDWIRNGAKR